MSKKCCCPNYGFMPGPGMGYPGGYPGGFGGGFGCGGFGGNCSWIWIIILLFCCCGNRGFGGLGGGCGRDNCC